VYALNVRGQLSRGAEEVLQVAGGSDILVFTETWLGEGQRAPDIAGYRAFHFGRPHALQAGSHRGGVACYVRERLQQHVTHFSSDASNSFAVMRISKEAGFQRDLYLFVCYVVPRGSTRISMATRGIWVELQECIGAALSRGQVLMVGDLNARTGTASDFSIDSIVDDEFQIGSGPTCAPRNNQDTVVNSHGRELLKLCHRTGLRIANGRVLGDELGCFSYVSPSGDASLVDYVVACPETFGLVTHLSVVPAPFTDHQALQFELALTTPMHDGDQPSGPAPEVRRMGGTGNIERWVNDVLPAYAADLADITSLATNAPRQGTVAVHSLCDRFDKLLAESFAIAKHQGPSPSAPAQPRWFDHELAWGRRAATAAMRRNPRSAVALQLRKEYQRTLQRKQRRFKRSQVISLVNKASEMGKDFWRRFKPVKSVEPSITKGQWLSHFSKLLGETPTDSSSDSNDALASRAIQANRFADGSELNTPFTAVDIIHGVRILHKSSSTIGFLSVDALHAAVPMLAPAVAALFNAAAQVGSLSEAWSLCAVTPIHKSGGVTDPSNYRGIAVGTVLAKLYATLFNERLTHWAESNGLRAMGQAGFREDYRCSDHLLVLRTLVEQQRRVKSPLYTCFVDFKKAFDSIPRDLLWAKLGGLGVHGWFLDGIKALYGKVPMAVKTPQGLTSAFESVMGVKQGCPLSPTLFGLYLDDLEDVMRARQDRFDLPSLSGALLLALLYADDLALVATSARGLQQQLDVLHDYARQWGLTVNVAKTKAVIFRAASTPVCSNPSLTYDGRPIEFVESFKYLGVDLHCTKPFGDAGLPRKESGERAMLAMLCRCRELGIEDPLLQVKLFDALVQPVMLYAVELWGARDVGKGEFAADLVHRAFLRRLLGVRTGTPNMAVLAEVGRYPLQVFAAKMLLNYWNRLVVMDDARLVKRAFVASAALAPHTAANSSHKSWAGQLSAFLAALGLPQDLSNPHAVNVKHILAKLQSAYLESVSDSSSSMVQQYLRMRDDLTPEGYSMAPYLQAVGGWKQRKHLAQLRVGSASWLAVAAGRATGMPRAERVCQRCQSSEVDDEEHIIFRCSALSAQRLQHAHLFSPWPDSLRSFMARDPTAVAAFVHSCYEASKALYG
jgi:hypothetical protein